MTKCDECGKECNEDDLIFGACKECASKILDKVEDGVIKRRLPKFEEFN